MMRTKRLPQQIRQLVRLQSRRFAESASPSRTIQDPIIENVLKAYPLFNLNDGKKDALGRQLGPKAGDEAILTLSGGVDSSIAAYMALTAGGLTPVRTIFMRNWNSLEEQETFEPGAGGPTGCQWMRDWDCVQRTASWLKLDNPELVDFSTPYWNNVFSPSLDEWARGRTPNPDVMCNREIKFGELLRKLDSERQASPGAFGRQIARQWLVTGHYAGVQYFYPSEASDVQHGKLFRAKDHNKDQAYFLSSVNSLHLGRSHFPLAKVQKTEVRSLARSLGMPTADSEESMGICFVGKRDKRQSNEPAGGEMVTESKDKRSNANPLGFAGFLTDYIERSPGAIVTIDGTRVGTHSGLHTMTVGQRARIGGNMERLFVAAKKTDTNQIVVVPGLDHAMLQCVSLDVEAFDVVCSTPDYQRFERLLSDGATLHAQIRHRQHPVPCRAELLGPTIRCGAPPQLRVHFDIDRPMDSVAEGQICALYLDQECLGSGVVSTVETLASRDYVS